MATSSDIKVDFKIHKMSREIYNELCSQGYIEQHPYDLFLIDDKTKFDVGGKRIVNVADPEDGLDALNISYAKNNLIWKDNINEYVNNTRIVTPNLSNCISSDLGYYRKLSGDSDWVVNVISGAYTPSTLSVNYNDTVGSGKGWYFYDASSVKYYTGTVDRDAQKIHFVSADANLEFYGYRECWEKIDQLQLTSQGGGGSYTKGHGIDINDNTISVILSDLVYTNDNVVVLSNKLSVNVNGGEVPENIATRVISSETEYTKSNILSDFTLSVNDINYPTQNEIWTALSTIINVLGGNIVQK